MDTELFARLKAIEDHLKLARVPLSPLLTPADVARHLRVSKPTALKLIRSGELQSASFMVGTRKVYRVSVDQLRAFLSARKEKGALIGPSKTIFVPKVKV